MTSFLKFSLSLPRVPSVGEVASRLVGDVLRKGELGALKLDAADEAIVDSEVVMELGRVLDAAKFAADEDKEALLM
jgi:hypothetical protein